MMPEDERHQEDQVGHQDHDVPEGQPSPHGLGSGEINDSYISM